MVKKGGRQFPPHVTNSQAVQNLLKRYSHHELVKLEEIVSAVGKAAEMPVCFIAAVHILQSAVKHTEERA